MGLILFALLTVGACGGLYWLVTQIANWVRLPASALPFLTFIAVVVAGLVIVMSVRSVVRAARPVGELIDAAERVEAGDYAVQVIERGPREVRALVRAFNAMTSRLHADQQQRRQLLADVTHELRTPLTVLQSHLEGVLDGIYPADAQHLTPLLEETRVMARLINDLRTLTQAESGLLQLHREPTDLALLVQEAASAFRPVAEVANISLSVSTPASGNLLELDPVRLREVLGNLLTNALRYTPSGGRIEIALEFDPHGAQLSVGDTGPGVPPADLPHLFDRFYKSADSSGSGLGLTIAKNLVEAHGGSLSARNRSVGGLQMTVKLPLSS